MSKRMIWIIAGVLIIILGAAALWGPIASNVEQAKYTVKETHGKIEIRTYAPMIVAEVDVSGERDKAINDGFRLIADYIFGNNLSSQNVSMTAPVTQQSSEKIAMTAPVTQQVTQQGAGSWKVRFVMPANYTLQTLPKPKNDAVKLKDIPEQYFAVIRFSGMSSKENLETHLLELQSFLTEKKLQPLAAPTYAFYNPPFTLPFLRRNEVMIEIKNGT